MWLDKHLQTNANFYFLCQKNNAQHYYAKCFYLLILPKIIPHNRLKPIGVMLRFISFDINIYVYMIQVWPRVHIHIYIFIIQQHISHSYVNDMYCMNLAFCRIKLDQIFKNFCPAYCKLYAMLKIYNFIYSATLHLHTCSTCIKARYQIELAINFALETCM